MTPAEAVAAGPTRQAELLAAGALTSRQLTEATLDAIDRENPAINATVAVYAEEALAAADEADRRRAAGESGPLLGIPVAVKDDLDIAGQVTGKGSRAMLVPANQDADLVAAMRAAGMVLVAKSALPELAIFGFTESEANGITRNPLNLATRVVDRPAARPRWSPPEQSASPRRPTAPGRSAYRQRAAGSSGSSRPRARCRARVAGTTCRPRAASRRASTDSALFLDAFGTFAESLVEAAANGSRTAADRYVVQRRSGDQGAAARPARACSRRAYGRDSFARPATR